MSDNFPFIGSLENKKRRILQETDVKPGERYCRTVSTYFGLQYEDIVIRRCQEEDTAVSTRFSVLFPRRSNSSSLYRMS